MHTELVREFQERRKRLGFVKPAPAPVSVQVPAEKPEPIIIPIREVLRDELQATKSQQEEIRDRLDEIRQDIRALYLRAKEIELALPDTAATGGGKNRVPARAIIAATAKYYGLRKSELYSHRRPKNIVRAKHVAMFLVHTMTLNTLPAIGRMFGGRDHTTVLHAIRKIKGKIEADEALASEVRDIMGLFESEEGLLDNPRQRKAIGATGD